MTDNDSKLENIKKGISDHPDFPKPGVLFRDIFPVLRNPPLFKDLIDVLVATVRNKCPDVELIIGLESRGFLFGPMMAEQLNVGFVPIRKAGKLPGETVSVSYSLEYGTDKFEVQKDAVKAGQKVVIVDDLLATGGTMSAACELVEKVQGKIANCVVVIELLDLKGRDKIKQPFTSLIKY